MYRVAFLSDNVKVTVPSMEITVGTAESRLWMFPGCVKADRHYKMFYGTREEVSEAI